MIHDSVRLSLDSREFPVNSPKGRVSGEFTHAAGNSYSCDDGYLRRNRMAFYPIKRNAWKWMRPVATATKRKTGAAKPKKVSKALLDDFGKVKYPRLRSSGQANVRTHTEMKACTELSSVNLTDGAFTTIATVQLNSAFEPVDNEAEQPRGFDQFTTWYKRFRVSSCAVDCMFSMLGPVVTALNAHPFVYGITAHLAGEAPTSLREAVENPRSVYKYCTADYYGQPDGTPATNAMYRAPCAKGRVEACFDCAEIFGDKRNYYTSDDVVGYTNANPSVLILATIWIVPVNGDSYDDWVVYPLVTTNQKLVWFGPEKLSPS